jgi:MFS family permease
VSGRIKESSGAIVAVFRNPGLRRVNLALAGSVMGDWAYGVAIAVYAYLEGGATAVGVLGVVRLFAVALLTPFTSTLVDRFDRIRIMVLSDLVRFVLVLVAAGAVFADGPPLFVYAIAVVTSLSGTAFRPAQAAILPRLARHPGELTAANVASSTIESVGFFVGPAVAGLLLLVAGVGEILVFNALTFLWSAAMIRGLRAATSGATVEAEEEAEEEAEAQSAGSTGLLAGATEGFRAILADRDLGLLVGLYTAQTVIAGASLVFTVAVALDLLEMSESGAGLLDAVVGVGGLIGGFVALLLAQRGRLARDFGLGVAAWAAPLLLVAAFPELWAAVVAMVVIGVANSVVDVNAFTIMQRLVPDEVMGRVFGAVESATIAGMALGALAMPLLMNTVGLRAGLLVLGSVVTVLALLASVGLRRIDLVALAPEGLDLLRAVGMLRSLPGVVLERLARATEVREYPAGAVVFAEGEPGDHFHVIEDGRVTVTIRGGHVRDLGPGDSFGEIALLRDIPRTATVTALVPLRTRTLRREDFVPAVTGHGDARAEAEETVGRWLTVV